VDVLACGLYMYVACAKAVDDCESVVGVKWSQLENFVVFVGVLSALSGHS